MAAPRWASFERSCDQYGRRARGSGEIGWFTLKGTSRACTALYCKMPLRPGRAAADAAREALNNAASTRVVISDSDDDDDGEEESDDEASSSVEEEEHTKELSAYEVMLSVLMHFSLVMCVSLLSLNFASPFLQQLQREENIAD